MNKEELKPTPEPARLSVDLNSDLGESYGSFVIGCDEEILKYVSSANIACGWHGGDPVVMEKTVKTAKKNGIAIGAHPSYPDLMGFGRRKMLLSADEAKAYTKYQLGAFWAFAKSNNMEVAHIKPHGAMYNDAGADYNMARAIAEATFEVNPHIAFMALAGSQMVKAADDVGLRVISEVFADRAYEEDGSLVARSKPGAIIHDEIICMERIIKMLKYGTVTAISGKEINVVADSICVHGDNPQALLFVKKITESLKSEGFTIAPCR